MNANRKPNLLVLTSTYPRWPNDHEPPFVHELARRLVGQFNVTVLAPHAPGALLHESMDGVDVQRFRYAPERFEQLAYDGGIPTRLKRQPWLAVLVPLFVLSQLISATRLALRVNPAVIHAHWLIPSGFVGAILKKLLPGRRRLVTTAHGADVFLDNRWLIDAIKWQAASSADVLTVVSQALYDHIGSHTLVNTKVKIISMGVDLQTLFTPKTKRSKTETLVFVGRLVEKKGVADLLKAMSLLHVKRPGLSLQIAGHGPLEQDLRALTDQLGLGNVVEFIGHIPNIQLPAVFQRSTLAVLPFRKAKDGDVEGLGLVAVEAMGCGLPVVVGDVPAIHDVISHGDTGWIVPTNNPTALANAITRLLDEPLLMNKLGRNARFYAINNFDWPIIAERYQALLYEVIK